MVIHQVMARARRSNSPGRSDARESPNSAGCEWTRAPARRARRRARGTSPARGCCDRCTGCRSPCWSSGSVSTFQTIAFGISVQLPRLQRVGDRGERRVEIGVRDAPAFAGAAVVARLPAVDRLGEVGRAADRDGAAELLLHARPQPRLAARHRHRRAEIGRRAARSRLRPGPRSRRSPRRCRSRARGRRS